MKMKRALQRIGSLPHFPNIGRCQLNFSQSGRKGFCSSSNAFPPTPVLRDGWRPVCHGWRKLKGMDGRKGQANQDQHAEVIILAELLFHAIRLNIFSPPGQNIWCWSVLCWMRQKPMHLRGKAHKSNYIERSFPSELFFIWRGDHPVTSNRAAATKAAKHIHEDRCPSYWCASASQVWWRKQALVAINIEL